jgi:hypothetical protein
MSFEFISIARHLAVTFFWARWYFLALLFVHIVDLCLRPCLQGNHERTTTLSLTLQTVNGLRERISRIMVKRYLKNLVAAMQLRNRWRKGDQV